MEDIVEIDPLTEFFDAIKNPITKDRYMKRLKQFFDYLKIEGDDLKEQAKAFVSKAKQDKPDFVWVTSKINEYMRYQKTRAEKKEIRESTLPNFYKPIKLFCVENDIAPNWSKISRRIPRGRMYADDRGPSRSEILDILKYPDRRIKPALLVMASSGIRIGAWDYLRWKDVELIEKGKKIIAAKLTVYRGEPEKYETFITPEAYFALQEWMDFRSQQGEKISGESWVMRDLWNTTSKNKRGAATLPKQLKSSGIKRLVERALWAQGVRKELESGKRRHEFQANHGFRKFFTTLCLKHISSLVVQILRGDNTGLLEAYNRPSEQDMLKEYLKAVPELTLLENAQPEVAEDIELIKKEIADLKHVNQILARSSELQGMLMRHMIEGKVVVRAIEGKRGFQLDLSRLSAEEREAIESYMVPRIPT